MIEKELKDFAKAVIKNKGIKIGNAEMDDNGLNIVSGEVDTPFTTLKKIRAKCDHCGAWLDLYNIPKDKIAQHMTKFNHNEGCIVEKAKKLLGKPNCQFMECD